MQGTVKFYNTAKGFGFIVPEDGSKDMFFHVTECAEGYIPQEGDAVSFTEGAGKDGRPAAKGISPSKGGGASMQQQDDEDME